MKKDEIKEQLLFIFKKLFEREKITIEEYNRAIKIVIEKYT